jgi:hypothetical protein
MSETAPRWLLLAVLLPVLGACSMGQIVARSSVSIMDGNIDAMNRETDLLLAGAAIPANLKLIEGLLREDPTNTELLVSAAQGFYGYAFGFVELNDTPRAATLYERCFEFGQRALVAMGVTVDLPNASPARIDQALAALDRKAVPALFWTGSCWAKLIDLDRTDPARLAQLASTERLMHRALQLQPDFYYGGIYLYYGVYYGGRAPMLGGDFGRAEENFTMARRVTDNRLLIIDVLQAEYLERQRQEQRAFRALLRRVIDDPVGSFPEMALANQIARQRAAYLLTRENDWF